MDLFGVPFDSWVAWVSAIAGALSSVVVATVLIKKRVGRAISHIKAIIDRFHSYHDRLDELSAKVSVVLSEVTPNGGSSLKDAVRRIEHRINDLELTSLTVLDHEQRGVFKTNAAGQIVWANRSCAQAFDRGRDELFNYGWLSMVNADMRTDVTREWESAVKFQRQIALKFNITTTEGETKALVLKAYPMLGAHNTFLGYIGTIVESSDYGN